MLPAEHANPQTPPDRGAPRTATEAGAVTLDNRGIATLAAQLQQRGIRNPQRRCIAAIAGLPGCGKSTLARALCIHLNRSEPGVAAVVGLDGFHLTNDKLKRAGLDNEKGSPGSFDARGYFKLLQRAIDIQQSSAIPVYDRSVHEPIYTGKPEDQLTAQTRIVITEGNYLLLDMLPWTAIDDFACFRWMLDTPAVQSQAWLIRRHIATGKSIEQAHRHYEQIDLPNTQLIQARSRHGDRVLNWPDTMLDSKEQ